MSGASVAVAAASPMGWRDVALAAVLAVFTYAMGWTALDTTGFGHPPDEWAHVTYLDEIAAGDRLVPDYADSRILPQRVRPNYLNHPPLYYSVLGLAARAMGWDAVGDQHRLRALSAAMVALGMFFWVLTARLLGVPPAWAAAIVTACNAIPMFPYLAGSLNNDNLAFLGVAVAVYGAALVARRPGPGLLVAATGLAVTVLAKATAGLFLSVFAVAWVAAWGWPRWRGRQLPPLAWWLGAGCVLLLAAAWFAYALARYGGLFPSAGETYPTMPPESPVGATAFAVEFTQQIWKRLPIVTSHRSLDPLQGHLRTLFWTMLAAAAAAWLGGTRGSDADARRLRWCFLAALMVMMAAHLGSMRSLYLETGRFAGMQPRYYAFALPGLFLFGFLGGWRRAWPSLLLAVVAACALALVATVPARNAQRLAQMPAQAAAAEARTLQFRPADSGAAAATARIGIAAQSAGYVDTLTVADGVAKASGWALQASDRRPARAIVVMVDDRILGTAPTGRERPDVARVFGVAHAARSGFVVEIRGLPPEIGACDLRLAAEQADGALAWLRFKPCAAAAP